MKRKVYVAGPMTLGSMADNIRQAVFAGDALLRAGLIPFVPHIDFTWNLISPHDWETWLKWDLEWLAECDGLLRLPGESKGADIEVQEADRLGMPVFYSVAETLAWDDYEKAAERAESARQGADAAMVPF